MKELDKILDKHLPDAGLCQRGKMLNKERKRKLKLDIEQYIQSGYYDHNVIISTPNTVIIDELQLKV